MVLWLQPVWSAEEAVPALPASVFLSRWHTAVTARPGGEQLVRAEVGGGEAAPPMVPDAVAGAASKIAGMKATGWVDGTDGHTVAGMLDGEA